MREIAEAIAEGLHVPAVSISEDEAPEHFGWLMKFTACELTASGRLTQQRLNTRPKGSGLIADLQQMNY